jgi:hypothetical protein
MGVTETMLILVVAVLLFLMFIVMIYALLWYCEWFWTLSSPEFYNKAESMQVLRRSKFLTRTLKKNLCWSSDDQQNTAMIINTILLPWWVETFHINFMSFIFLKQFVGNTGVLFIVISKSMWGTWHQSGRSVKLTIYIHIVLKYRTLLSGGSRFDFCPRGRISLPRVFVLCSVSLGKCWDRILKYRQMGWLCAGMGEFVPRHFSTTWRHFIGRTHN